MNNSNPTILYVDDDDNDVVLLKHAIRSASLRFNVQSVTDPENAISYLSGDGPYSDRKCFPVPSLVLLDLKMPRMNGLEVLTWIRNQPLLKRMVVIVLTASSHAMEINSAYELGANSYLVKPVELTSLVEMVKGIAGYWMSLNVPAMAQQLNCRPAAP
jgi:CheY-like chemotaxis protein